LLKCDADSKELNLVSFQLALAIGFDVARTSARLCPTVKESTHAKSTDENVQDFGLGF
jgi:hypothetical protein